MITERDIDVAIVEAQRQAEEVMRSFLADYLGPRAKRHPLLTLRPGEAPQEIHAKREQSRRTVEAQNG